MRILYVGPNSGTSRQRVMALRRIGHDVVAANPFALLPQLPLVSRWAFKTGALGLGDIVRRGLARSLKQERFDLVFVDNGELISPAAAQDLKQRAPRVLLFNQDNPFVPRDGHRWRLLLKALPLYDLFITPRYSSVDPARAAGARDVMRAWLSADELIHRPIHLTDEDRSRFGSEVVFVGTWMPERGPLLCKLIEAGVPLRIFGDRWHKAPEADRLLPHLAQGHLEATDYVKPLAATRIAIALLSKGNKDLHTTRSLEIPAIGTLLCGERTREHQELYVDGKEAVFWSSAEECARHCLALLAEPERIDRIAAAGRARALRNGNFNEQTLIRIIGRVCASPDVSANASRPV